MGQSIWDFSESEKMGRCDFCQCDGRLSYIDVLDQWLCFDCETEFNDADEVMQLTGWISGETNEKSNRDM